MASGVATTDAAHERGGVGAGAGAAVLAREGVAQARRVLRAEAPRRVGRRRGEEGPVQKQNFTALSC